MSTQVETLYGSKMSLRARDIERGGNHLRQQSRPLRVDSGIKNTKDHVGKISSYNIGQITMLLYGIKLEKRMSGIRKIMYQ